MSLSTGIPVALPVAQARLGALFSVGAVARAADAAQRHIDALTAVDGQSSQDPIRVEHIPGYHRGSTVVFPVRWNAGSGQGQWNAALDANLELDPESLESTRFSMVGAYRFPAGLGQAESWLAPYNDYVAVVLDAHLRELAVGLLGPVRGRLSEAQVVGHRPKGPSTRASGPPPAEH